MRKSSNGLAELQTQLDRIREMNGGQHKGATGTAGFVGAGTCLRLATQLLQIKTLFHSQRNLPMGRRLQNVVVQFYTAVDLIKSLRSNSSLRGNHEITFTILAASSPTLKMPGKLKS